MLRTLPEGLSRPQSSARATTVAQAIYRPAHGNDSIGLVYLRWVSISGMFEEMSVPLSRMTSTTTEFSPFEGSTCRLDLNGAARKLQRERLGPSGFCPSCAST